MELVLITLVLSFAMEVAVYVRPWPWQGLHSRRIVSGVAIFLTAFSIATFLLIEPTLMGLLFFTVGGHRVVNLLRTAEARMNERYLSRVTLRTSMILFGATILWSFVWAGIHRWSVTAFAWLVLIAFAQITVAVMFFISTVRTTRKTAIQPIENFVPSEKLPSITVAIPARNETDELQNCLEALIASDYPKLEILVLDDCSQLKRTPAIIRDFAHAGVRFLEGSPPHKTWFAKNHAYAQLAQEANGQIIVFMGVDILVQPHTLRELIETMLERNKRMISVLPLRHLPEKIQISLSQATRYMWELAPPRKLFKRPPILSSCWAIYSADLKKFGGFAAVSRMVVPESYFAKQIIRSCDGYAFIRSNAHFGLTSAKSLASQRNTAIRVRYPSLHRRPENVLAVSLFEAVVIAGSYAFAVAGWAQLVPPAIGMVASIAAALFAASYSIIVVSTKVNSWYIAPFWALPAVIYDLILMHVSMWRYEFTDVVWKGRNVCLPVMHVIPRLPELPERPLGAQQIIGQGLGKLR